MPHKFYAVAIGRKPGVYTDWASAKAQVESYTGARYKGFPDRESAEAFVRHLGSSVLAQLATAAAASPAATTSPVRPVTAPPIAHIEAVAPRDPMRAPHGPDTLVVFCDGSALANGRKRATAGYAIVWPNHPHLDASAPLPGPPGDQHTNNRAEFSAFIAAMEAAARADPACHKTLYVYTDSMLLMKTATQWLPGWKKNGWKRADGKPIANPDLVRSIDALLTGPPRRRVVWRHVEAHTGRQDWESHWNDRADQAAKAAAQAAAAPR